VAAPGTPPWQEGPEADTLGLRVERHFPPYPVTSRRVSPRITLSTVDHWRVVYARPVTSHHLPSRPECRRESDHGAGARQADMQRENGLRIRNRAR